MIAGHVRHATFHGPLPEVEFDDYVAARESDLRRLYERKLASTDLTKPEFEHCIDSLCDIFFPSDVELSKGFKSYENHLAAQQHHLSRGLWVENWGLSLAALPRFRSVHITGELARMDQCNEFEESDPFRVVTLEYPGIGLNDGNSMFQCDSWAYDISYDFIAQVLGAISIGRARLENLWVAEGEPANFEWSLGTIPR